MKSLTITADACNNNGLTVQETFILAAFSYGELDLDATINSLIQKSCLSRYGVHQGLSASVIGVKCLNNIITDSNKILPKTKELEDLAIKLREIYPEGKKGDYYWRSSQKEIVDRLKKFFTIYGNNWSSEEIIKATTSYVQQNTGNQYMRVLKYFILKDNRSDLAERLENKDVDTTSTDFTTTLI